MKKKKIIAITAIASCVVLAAAIILPIVLSGGAKKDSIVIMTEELSGLFNPFYATTGADQTVVGMTQIGMLTTDKDGKTAAGDDLSTVVKAYEQKIVNNAGSTETVYNFVIKNGLKFSDGKPLTMNDVLFNMYEYLDPVYTGSSTMYSTKIKGLSQYRTQTSFSGVEGDALEQQIASEASSLATFRILELVDLYKERGLISGSQSLYSLTEQQMRDAISTYIVNDSYKDAVATETQQQSMTEEQYRELLLEDYELTLKTFKEELTSDFRAAKESYDTTTVPYSEWKQELESDIFKFFLYEGYIIPEYNKVLGKTDRTKILRFDGTELLEHYKTEEAAINMVYENTIKSNLDSVLTQWGTSAEIHTQYAAHARSILLRKNISSDGSLTQPNISGIVSLGHADSTPNEVTVDGDTYKVAKSHNEDGTPANSGEYDILQITVLGTDPKAIYNFGFRVSPAHYYTADAEFPNGRPIDIKNNKFGVEYASAEFQSRVIQSQLHLEVPVGAGPFVATDRANNDNPAGANFSSSNIVYFKANKNFMFPVKAEKLRMQVVGASNALDKLVDGEVDFVEPQFTKANSARLKGMSSDGYRELSAWQLGYGYIGINAGKVPNINIRRAIMSAMQTSLALGYYESGTVENINWPMSMVSWAYPYAADRKTPLENSWDYTKWAGITAAENKIRSYMNLAGAAEGDSRLSITFTVAGASITEHPTYSVFKQASEILNDLGWNVEVKADSNALRKLSTGSLQVWAAAWGSTVDPDMYQVYHKNSTATSVNAWGYREIKLDTSTYSKEYDIINRLSVIIDEARTLLRDEDRIPLYKDAMELVLELAVEMPVYQRSTLYAYNSNTITGINSDVNHFTSPLERIWELEMVG